MDKPPPYSPQERPPPAQPSAPYAYIGHTTSAPSYPGGPPPYPSVGDTPGQPPQIGFVIPSTANQSYTAYTVPSTTVVVQPNRQPSVLHFGRDPVMVTCPGCGHYGLTKATPESGCLVWLICGLLCLFGLWCGCCLIPFCITSAKNVKHTCVNCRRQLGRFAPL
ncbi:Lipopolysaccharide-induced tumor necrosis factor-alpha factor [Fasciola hepatica]|uniref:Lipopolysaccharide-induced tumor necrosis factor-alpha factor n=1 Tax=Fasciola hepatica TaxID=6192 RepID=A0A4E0RFR7_FASHE|nr:Lipopolysaccharide-induced tumor necrosis factor-alpha factor [Fasciola hepatica]